MKIQGVGSIYQSGYNNKDKKKQEGKEKVSKNKKPEVKEESPSFKDILIMKGR